MVNLCNKNGCRGLNCHKSPRFNFPNVARGIFCDAHKLDGEHLQVSADGPAAIRLCCECFGSTCAASSRTAALFSLAWPTDTLMSWRICRHGKCHRPEVSAPRLHQAPHLQLPWAVRPRLLCHPPQGGHARPLTLSLGIQELLHVPLEQLKRQTADWHGVAFTRPSGCHVTF